MEEKRKMIQIENNGIYGTKSVIIPSFREKKYIMTANENKMYSCLEKIYNKTNIKISIQVALNQIVEMNTRRYYKDYLTQKIQGISIDYVLFNITTNKILACIELNGQEHEKDEERKKRDLFLNDVFEYLNIPLISIKNRNEYNPEEIKEIINIEIQNKKRC